MFATKPQLHLYCLIWVYGKMSLLFRRVWTKLSEYLFVDKCIWQSVAETHESVESRMMDLVNQH